MGASGLFRDGGASHGAWSSSTTCRRTPRMRPRRPASSVRSRGTRQRRGARSCGRSRWPETSRFVGQHGVYADGEVASVRTPATEVAGDDLGGHRYERLIRALPAPDPGLVADSGHPLVGAGGGVAGPAAPCIAPPLGKHVLTAAKQRTKQSNLLGRRRGSGYRCLVQRRALTVGTSRVELDEPRLERRLLSAKCSQPAPDRRNVVVGRD